MANTFFGFDSTLDHGGALHDADEVNCTEAEEDAYDALNDETFGGLGDSTNIGDWEQQHEKFAEFTESAKHYPNHNENSDDIENSLSQLVLDDSDDSLPSSKDCTDWSYNPVKNGDVFNSELLSSLQRTVSSTTHFFESQNASKVSQKMPMSIPHPASTPNNRVPKKICTVEELERGLRQQKAPVILPPHKVLPQNASPNQNYFQHHSFRYPPPGFHLHHMGMPPGHRYFGPDVLQPGNPRMIPPHQHYNSLLFGNMQYPHVNSLYQVPPRNAQMERHHLQNNRNLNNNRLELRLMAEEININKDEYAGLMTNREKQWLLNIQQLQLNTGTPYFDDYYYTVFKERKVRNDKENLSGLERNLRYQRHNHHRNQERQENTLTPRVYTPLQFENSLGKLQCGSVTAPRKIIDTDVVTLEKDTENLPNRDTRKTKQILLELEGFYSLMLKAEDIRNPLAISNMEKLIELKQKQRLKELEAAPTPEQKQEVLKLLQQESMPPNENPADYYSKIISGFMQEDKFCSYMNIRKGKLLLLRILPNLTMDNFHTNFLELWVKVLLALPIVGRRDTLGDNILHKFHPYFKRYIQTSKLADVLEIVSNLVEFPRQDNNRSTPSCLPARAPLHYVTSNRLGVSALVTIFVRMEYLISSENPTDSQLKTWTNFILNWADLGSGKSMVAAPIELIPRQIFIKHTNRISTLSEERRQILERYFVDVN